MYCLSKHIYMNTICIVYLIYLHEYNMYCLSKHIYMNTICIVYQNTFKFNNLLPKNHSVYEMIWKNIVQADRPHENLIRRMRSVCWKTKVTYTHSEYVILIAFTAATMFTLKRISFTLHLHCLSCQSYKIFKLLFMLPYSIWPVLSLPSLP